MSVAARSPARWISDTSRRSGLSCGNCDEHRFAVAEDRGQQVVEVVRDAAGELADRLHLLRLVQLRLDVAVLLAPRVVAQFALDDGGQARHVALHHVVVRALAHRFDGLFLADRAGDDDEGEVGAVLVHDAEGIDGAEAWGACSRRGSGPIAAAGARR